MAIDINKYLEDIDNEILGQKEELLTKLISKQLKQFQFDEINLSPNLISVLMSKQDIKIPVPSKKDIPVDIQEKASSIADIINANTAAIFTDLMVGNNVYLYGKAGTGKTTLAKKIVTQLLQRETFTINCNQFTSPINIIGGQTIEGYKQGMLVEAWQKGGALILDELPKLDPNTAGLLNEALAESAAEEKSEYFIAKDDYDKLLEMLVESDGKELGFSVRELDGKYIKTEYATITDGKGDKIRKNKNFCVIATGNTNMKEISANFSGNNRQDYSLVDRFAGSFYEITYDEKLERALTYSLVYKISIMIRTFLDEDESSVESVSLRTMLNFNRIFEQQLLRQIKSPYAVDTFIVGAKKSEKSGKEEGGRPMAKTLAESIQSFVESLPPAKRVAIAKTDIQSLASEDFSHEEFIVEFNRIHGVDPKAGEGKR